MKAKRIIELEKKIVAMRKAYWSGNPTASDYEYDTLYRELQSLNPFHTLLHEVESPELVGETIEHRKPMLSLNKVQSEEELFEWMKKVARDENEEFLFQPKFDGIACHYKRGTYITRGDGKVGQNITNACMSICEHDCDGRKEDFYGELIIRTSDFDSLYKSIKSKGGDVFKTARNAMSGIASCDDPEHYLSQGARINLVDYDKYSLKCQLKNVEMMYDTIYNFVSTIDYQLDGMVVRLADSEYGDSLGATSHHPRGAMALKFYNQSATTNLTGIEFGMGKEQITATAIFEPVEINGVTISRAVIPMKSEKLPNVIDGNFRVGAELTVERAGDVIPHITKIDVNADGDIISIDRCPFCQANLIVDSNSVICFNDNCSERNMQKLYHGLRELGIKGVAEQTIRKSFDAFQSWNKNKCGDEVSLDLYGFLSQFGRPLTKTILSTVQGFGDKSIDKLTSEINRIKSTTYERFIASLCIPGVGTKIATEIVKVMEFDKLFTVSEYDLSQINSVGYVMAERIFKCFQNEADYIRLLKGLFTFPSANTTQTTSANTNKKTVCFTGAMQKPRKEMFEIAENKGYEPTNSATKDLDILVVADGEPLTSSKCQKAQKYGTTIMCESDFIKL